MHILYNIGTSSREDVALALVRGRAKEGVAIALSADDRKALNNLREADICSSGKVYTSTRTIGAYKSLLGLARHVAESMSLFDPASTSFAMFHHTDTAKEAKTSVRSLLQTEKTAMCREESFGADRGLFTLLVGHADELEARLRLSMGPGEEMRAPSLQKAGLYDYALRGSERPMEWQISTTQEPYKHTFVAEASGQIKTISFVTGFGFVAHPWTPVTIDTSVVIIHQNSGAVAFAGMAKTMHGPSLSRVDVDLSDPGALTQGDAYEMYFTPAPETSIKVFTSTTDLDGNDVPCCTIVVESDPMMAVILPGLAWKAIYGWDAATYKVMPARGAEDRLWCFQYRMDEMMRMPGSSEYLVTVLDDLASAPHTPAGFTHREEEEPPWKRG